MASDEESISDFDRRETLLWRMCRLSAAMLLLSAASLTVGIISIATSDGKFPFNAGGAIVAGVMALLMSVCPMCMLFQAWKTGMSLNESFTCCTLTLAIWAGLTMLGIPFGFGLSGVYALNECIHPSEKTGCSENTDTKLALAVVTLILTSFLMILTLVIFFACCCNSKTFGVPLLRSEDEIRAYRARNGLRQHNTRHPARIETFNERIARIDQMSRTANGTSTPRRSHGTHNYNNEVNVHATGSFTPSPYGRSLNFDDILTGNITARNEHRTSAPVREPVDFGTSYEDPPPSYDEVMKQALRVPRETTL